MTADAEQRLNYFLNDYRIVTTSTDSVDQSTDNLIKTIILRVVQKRKTPKGYFTRGLIPYHSVLDDRNQFTSGMTLTGLSEENAAFLAGVTHFFGLTMEMLYDMGEVSDGEYGSIGYSVGNDNMYGAFKTLYEKAYLLELYPTFYTVSVGDNAFVLGNFNGNTARGVSLGCYTLVNFGGVITPFQLMMSAETAGISHTSGLPTGTAGNPLYYGLSAYTGFTSAFKNLYYNPVVHNMLRRNLNLYRDRGITFAGVLADFDPHYQFVKFADDAYLDSRFEQIASYIGSTSNPGWLGELLEYAGTTSGLYNLSGYQLANSFLDRFMEEIKRYPARYKMVRDEHKVGHVGVPYQTEVLGWSSKIPTPGTALDATGPFASVGQTLFLNRVAGLTLYPAPSAYNYLGPTGATSFGGSGGLSGWNSYHKSLTADSSYWNEYFMLGGSASAASATYSASALIPANILTLFTDTGAGLDPLGSTMNYLESYYNDLYSETLKYGGYRYATIFPINFIPRFNPLFPVQTNGSYSAKNYPSRRECTIHRDFGNNATERLYNLKQSMTSSIQTAMKAWKILLDERSKYNYRILPVIQGRNEDYDLTRGGSVPYAPDDFVEYLMQPLFTGDVPANGFIFKDDINERLLNDFYYGNISRGAGEYTKVVTNKGISGSDVPTSFIRGLETYFFDLEKLQDSMSFSSTLTDLGLPAAASNHGTYMSNLNSGRFSDYRVFETNTGITGGNTKIPYGNFGNFKWYLVPIRTGSILQTNTDLLSRWTSEANVGITNAYQILRDAYFELTKEQLAAAYEYFEDEEISTYVEYRSSDREIGR